MEKLLGKELFECLKRECDIRNLNEVRLRLNSEIMIKVNGEALFLPTIADAELIERIIKSATNNSRYAYEKEIGNGYIDYEGGVRLGLVGEGVCTAQGDISLNKIFSLCIRIPHEIMGCAAHLQDLFDDFQNTLIISPPGGGKTTLLRDMARILSQRYDVLVIDERGEICGKNLCMRMGNRCDVMQGVEKHLVYDRAVRTMAPQIVVCDELFGKRDYNAVKKLSFAGIKVLATLHSDSDVDSHTANLFPNRVILSSIPQPGSIKSILRGTSALRE